MLQVSINNLNGKFEDFRSGFENKINAIERNYESLSQKIDQLAEKQ